MYERLGTRFVFLAADEKVTKTFDPMILRMRRVTKHDSIRLVLIELREGSVPDLT